MKTFVTFALVLVLTASLLVGCGCTNRNMDSTSAPTVLPTNEEIWNSTETVTQSTSGATSSTETTGIVGSVTETTDATENTTIENKVNASSDLTNKLLEQEKAAKATEGNTGSSSSRMMPRTR